jgi:hypothetical protein
MFELNYDMKSSLRISYSDPESEDVAMTITEKPMFVSYNELNKEFVIEPTKKDDIGEHYLKVEFTDGTNTVNREISISVYDTYEIEIDNSRIYDSKKHSDNSISIVYDNNTNDNLVHILRVDKEGQVLWNNAYNTKINNIRNYIDINSNGHVALLTRTG